MRRSTHGVIAAGIGTTRRLEQSDREVAPSQQHAHGITVWINRECGLVCHREIWSITHEGIHVSEGEGSYLHILRRAIGQSHQHRTGSAKGKAPMDLNKTR